MPAGVESGTEKTSSQTPPDDQEETKVLHSVAEAAKEKASSKQFHLVSQKRKEFLESDPTVKFMLQKLEEVCETHPNPILLSVVRTDLPCVLQAGCRFPEDRIVVAECEPGYLGRYLRHGLEICYNNYQGDPDELRNTMVHELVHAYDECRGKDFDWMNCRHIACSEVWCTQLPV